MPISTTIKLIHLLHDLHQLPVVANGRLVGMVTRADIMRFLEIRQDLGLDEFPEQRARSVAA